MTGGIRPRRLTPGRAGWADMGSVLRWAPVALRGAGRVDVHALSRVQGAVMSIRFRPWTPVKACLAIGLVVACASCGTEQADAPTNDAPAAADAPADADAADLDTTDSEFPDPDAPPGDTAGLDSLADALEPADTAGDATDLDTALPATCGDGQCDAGEDVTTCLPDCWCPPPKAVIELVEGVEVIPQTNVHLSGKSSTASCGTVAKYKWSADVPGVATPAFAPNDEAPEVSISVNTAGEYQFCLQVWDSQGNASPKSCTPTVLVIPNDAVHIELTWDTPNDPDQTDAGVDAGADLDLHFAHPLASMPDADCDAEPDPWFDETYDCYWFNYVPNWDGVPGSSPGDPSMDLDDSDGAGPESISLAQPQGTVEQPLSYAIGVHAYDDHGFGPSGAKVAVYVYGGLALQTDKVELENGDMWYVGRLIWPLDGGGGIQSCHQSGDACLGSLDPTAPGAGEMWQPSGEPCITQAYEPPGPLMP